MAGCETEACSPVISFNINGRSGKGKTRQICWRRRILCGITKICHTSECKQLKGSPYFTRRPLDGAALTLSEKPPLLHSFFLPLLYSHTLFASHARLSVSLPSLPVVFFLSVCFSFFCSFMSVFSPSLYSSAFLPSSLFLLLLTFLLSTLQPLHCPLPPPAFLALFFSFSSSSSSPLPFPIPLLSCASFSLSPHLSQCPFPIPFFPGSLLTLPSLFPLFPPSLFPLSDWGISTRGTGQALIKKIALHICSLFPWEQPAVHSYLSVCRHLSSSRSKIRVI